VNKKVSDLWKVPTPDEDSISDPFTPEELALALHHLEPGKYPGLDSIFWYFILQAGLALKSCLYGFFTSCMHQLKIPRIWKTAPVVAIPNANKSLGDPKELLPVV